MIIGTATGVEVAFVVLSLVEPLETRQVTTIRRNWLEHSGTLSIWVPL